MEVDRLPDGRALVALSLAELREACGTRGLSKGGSRKDLSDRLKLRLELEKLREESTRKAKAKEDVVPNIGLQDTAVGQSDIVRQYLEAQQRRLELFAQHGQTGGQPQQVQSFQATANATAVTAAEHVSATAASAAAGQYNHTQSPGSYEHKSPKGVTDGRSAAGVTNAKTKGITTRKNKSTVAATESSSTAYRGALGTSSIGTTKDATLTDGGHAAAHSGVKSGKATRSRTASSNFHNAMAVSKFDMLPSPTKKTRLGSTLPSAPASGTGTATLGSVVREDQLVSSLSALQTTKRRRGVVQPPATISKTEPVTAVKSSPRMTKITTNQAEQQRVATVQPKPVVEPVITLPVQGATPVPMKRGRGRPRKNAVLSSVAPQLSPTASAPTVSIAREAPADRPITEQPVPMDQVEPVVKSGSSSATTSSSLRDRGKDKERTLADETKTLKLAKITQSGQEERTSRNATVAGASTIATKSNGKIKLDKSPSIESVKALKDKAQDVAKPPKEIFASKRTERTTNRADNQIESIYKETKEGRPTRGKRLRSQDDVTAATPCTGGGGGGGSGGEPNKKLNKSNRHNKDKDVKSTVVVTAIKSVPASAQEKLTDEDAAAQESLPVDDPIEAALLALHGGCDDPALPTAAEHQPSLQVRQEAALAPPTSALSRPGKGRGGALREMRNQASSTERAPANTKALPEAALESSLSTLPVLPDVSSPERTEKKTSPSATTFTKETSSSYDIKELLSKSSPSGSIKAASVSPPSDRSDTRRSDRNQRETRKRSKVENIVQRLARREGRCSNTSVSSTDSAQAVSLREPIVLLERTELTAKQLSDTAPPVTVSKTNLKQKAEQAEIKIALSQSKEAESRLQKCHANDESRSPDIQRLPTPPRSKRPRRENGAATTATESGGSASETTIALSSCIGCSNETQTCEARNEPGTAPPARSTSLDDCVLRLLGASPIKALVETKPPEPTSLKAAFDPADTRNDSGKGNKQQESQRPQPQLNMATTLQATLRQVRRQLPMEHTTAPVDAPETESLLYKQVKNTSSKERHEQPTSTAVTPKESFFTSSMYRCSVTPATTSGRRDSVEAAVAALIGEPYEEITVYQSANVASSKLMKSGGTALRNEAAEKASTPASTVVSHLASKSSLKKYSSTTSSASNAVAATASTSSATTGRERSSRCQRDDNAKVQALDFVKGSAKSAVTTTATVSNTVSAATSGGNSSGNGTRSSRSRSSRHHNKADVLADKVSVEYTDKSITEHSYKTAVNDNTSVPDESVLTQATVSPSASAMKVRRSDSEQHLAQLFTPISSTVPALTKTSIKQQFELNKSELTIVGKEVQKAGESNIESGPESLPATIPTRERRGRRKAAASVLLEGDPPQLVQSIMKYEDTARPKVEAALVHTTGSCDTIADEKSADRDRQAADAVSKTTALYIETAQNAISDKRENNKAVGVDDVVVVQLQSIAADDARPKHEPNMRVVQSSAPQTSREPKVEVEHLVKIDTSGKEDTKRLAQSIDHDGPKSEDTLCDDVESVKLAESLQRQNLKTVTNTDVASTGDIVNEKTIQEDVISKATDKVEASKLVEDHEKPNETFTDGQEQEEEVCLILGDPDDAEDDDIPHVTISKPNQDTSVQQKSENKDSIGDVTPDIASAIERETSVTGNVSGAGESDDLWEAVFCADHDQNTALERSVWSEAESSHRAKSPMGSFSEFFNPYEDLMS